MASSGLPALLALAITPSGTAQDTVGEIDALAAQSPLPDLAYFIQNHMRDIAAVDMFVVTTATFRLLYALIVSDMTEEESSISTLSKIRHKSGYRANGRGFSPGTPRLAICCGTGTHHMVRAFAIEFG